MLFQYYSDSFWLFMFGNVAGVIVEGVWCKVRYGKWETHVVALRGPFNIVYGTGVVMFFVADTLFCGLVLPLRALIIGLVGSAVEFCCGFVIKVGIGMKAWDYRGHIFNIMGLISPKMTLAWCAYGLFFDRVFYEPLKALLSYMHGGAWDAACVVLSAFMAVNLSCTAVCIVRWANRHKNKPPLGRVGSYIDEKYPDIRMEKKFCNWSFIDAGAENIVQSRAR